MKLKPIGRGKIVLLASILVGLITTALLTAPLKVSAVDTFFLELSEFYDIYRDVYHRLESVTKEISNYMDDFANDFRLVFDEAIGELGVADPYILKTELEKEIANITQLESGEEVMALNTMIQELNRQQTRAFAQTILSKEGQGITAQKRNLNQTMLTQIQQQVRAVDSAPSTHDAIKYMAQITAGQAAMQGALQTEMLHNQQAQALANVNLVDIESLLSSDAKGDYIDRMGNALYLLKHNPSLLILP